MNHVSPVMAAPRGAATASLDACSILGTSVSEHQCSVQSANIRNVSLCTHCTSPARVCRSCTRHGTLFGAHTVINPKTGLCGFHEAQGEDTVRPTPLHGAVAIVPKPVVAPPPLTKPKAPDPLPAMEAVIATVTERLGSLTAHELMLIRELCAGTKIGDLIARHYPTGDYGSFDRIQRGLWRKLGVPPFSGTAYAIKRQRQDIGSAALERYDQQKD